MITMNIFLRIQQQYSNRQFLFKYEYIKKFKYSIIYAIYTSD